MNRFKEDQDHYTLNNGGLQTAIDDRRRVFRSVREFFQKKKAIIPVLIKKGGPDFPFYSFFPLCSSKISHLSTIKGEFLSWDA